MVRSYRFRYSSELGFGATYVTTREIDDRLIMRHKFALVDARLHLREQLSTKLRCAREFWAVVTNARQ